MNIKLLIFGLIHQLALVDWVYSACSEIVTRKELRQLSNEELDRFLTATKKLHDNMDTYDWFVRTHALVGIKAHGVPAVLPWHRAFLRKYEIELQKIDPRVVLPYWDWSVDWENAEQSPVLSDKMMGGNGQGKDMCVVDGVAANWRVRTPWNRCLKRQYSNGNRVGRLISKDEMEFLIQSNNNFRKFRIELEIIHLVTHTNLGGNWADMSQLWSPNDPLLWMHHAFVDKMWFEWQMRDTRRLNEYGGLLASVDDDLWRLDTKVRDVMDTKSDGYCYQYDRYGSSNTQKSLAESPVMVNQMSAKSNESIWDKIKNMPMSVFEPKNLVAYSGLNANQTKLTPPNRIPEDMIKMMNLNPEDVEKSYQFGKKIRAILNSNPNFKPDIAI